MIRFNSTEVHLRHMLICIRKKIKTTLEFYDLVTTISEAKAIHGFEQKNSAFLFIAY